MLKNSPLVTVVPGVDLERARRFYRDTLGLTPVLDNADPTTILFEAGNGSRIAIYERSRTKADHTIGAFIVDDIEAEVARLRAEGVSFRNEIVTGPGGKQILAEDPSGNVVELFQSAAPRS